MKHIPSTINRAAITVAPLSYQALEETYQSACYGRDEPTTIAASRATRDTIVWFLSGMAQTDAIAAAGAYIFNAAVIHSDRTLPDGVVAFLGGRHPAYLLFTGMSPEVEALVNKGKETLARLDLACYSSNSSPDGGYPNAAL